MKIYCCNCGDEVLCRLTDGKEMYPHRKDLYSIPFWIHDECKGFIGCHHKTVDRVKPLGVIASPEIKKARIYIHSVVDPIWKNKKMSRGKIYKKISDEIGYSFHTAEIKYINEARKIYKIAKRIAQEFKSNPTIREMR